jgi:hypothetical protein
MARAIVLASEQWFLLSGTDMTEITEGGLIINQGNAKKHQAGLNLFKQYLYMFTYRL